MSVRMSVVVPSRERGVCSGDGDFLYFFRIQVVLNSMQIKSA